MYIPSQTMKRILVLALLLVAARFLPAQNPIDFTLKDLNGNSIKLSDYLGKKVILIDFWATWCVPCVKELTHFQKFHETYQEKGFLILAISVDGPETVAMVKPFMKRYKYTFPVLFDTESRVIALYNPRVVMPYTVLINRQGTISNVHQGYSLGDEKVIEKEILDLLEPKELVKEQKFTLNINEAFLFRNFSDKKYVDRERGGRESQIVSQFDLSANAGDFLAGMRLDANLDFSPRHEKFSVAKKFIEFSRGNFSQRVGDFYYTVGRGLAFSLLKTFEQEGLEYIIDTTVMGGKAAYFSKQFSAEAFGGWIEREKSPFQEEKVKKDKVFGGTLGCRVKNFADLKLNFIGSHLEPGFLSNNKNVAMESFTLDIPNIKDRAKLYGEFLLVQKKKYLGEPKTYGHGLYLESGFFFLNNLTFLLEFKDYKNLDYEYNRPPLLESEQIPIVANQFVASAEDITGISGRVDYYFPKVNTLLFGKLTCQRDKKKGLFPRDIAHFFGGLEKKFKETGWLTILAGYRREQSASLVFYATVGNTFHYQSNLSYPLTPRLSLELDIESKNFSGQLSFHGKYYNYHEWRSYLSLHYSPRWIITLFFDQSTDPEILTFTDKKNWWSGQLEIKFSHAKSIKIFYGSIKGGVKCAGGICKFFPPFEGLRIDALLRF
jgi:peroxiredoxin